MRGEVREKTSFHILSDICNLTPEMYCAPRLNFHPSASDMIQVLHISAECYPAAKTGGLGDVVGSLPKYNTQAGILS